MLMIKRRSRGGLLTLLIRFSVERDYLWWRSGNLSVFAGRLGPWQVCKFKRNVTMSAGHVTSYAFPLQVDRAKSRPSTKAKNILIGSVRPLCNLTKIFSHEVALPSKPAQTKLKPKINNHSSTVEWVLAAKKKNDRKASSHLWARDGWINCASRNRIGCMLDFPYFIFWFDDF